MAIATSPVFGSFFAFGIPGATLSATTSITAVLFVGIHGPLYIGMPMLFVTVSCAIAWARVVRCLATSEELR